MPFDVKQFTVGTGTGTKSFTNGVMGTLKGALFYLSGAITNDTIAAGAILGIGATDGTNEGCVSYHRPDNQNPTDNGRTQRSDSVVVLDDGTGSNIVGRLSFANWLGDNNGGTGDDGVSLTIDTQFSTDYFLTIVFIYGSEVTNFDVGTQNHGTTVTPTTYANTSLGYTPDVLLFFGSGNVTALPFNSDNSNVAFGCAVNDGSQTQAFTNSTAQNNVTTTNCASLVRNDYAFGRQWNVTNQWNIKINSFDASGWTMENSASPGSSISIWVAMELSVGVHLSHMNWPSAGNYAETGPAFTPQFMMGHGAGDGNTINTINSTASTTSWLTMFDGTTVNTLTTTDEDGLNTTIVGSNTQSLHANSVKSLDPDGATTSFVGSTPVFDALGVDVTMTTNPTNNELGWMLFIEEAAGTSIPIFTHYYRQQG